MKEEAEAVVDTAKGVLQDLVVVVSLVHTLAESFGSASDLYRKLKRKSKSKSSDDEDESDHGFRRRPSRRQTRRDSSSDPDRKSRHHHLRWKSDHRKDDFSDSDEELIVTSSSRVRAEYDRGYERLGEPFARGDLTTQNQLQAQIIELQRTLLSIHQDYMLSTYLSPSSSDSHLIRLIQTTRAARAASIHALHMQYERLLRSIEPSVPDCPPTIPGAYPLPPNKPTRRDSIVRRPHSNPRNRSRSNSPDSNSGGKQYRILPFPTDEKDSRIQPFPDPDKEYHIQPFPNTSQPPKPKLFCIYAKDLQNHSRLPLTDNYRQGGNNTCPYCHTHIAIRPGKAWEIIAEGDCSTRHGERSREKKKFLVRNRFVVKSHRENGGFACILCARFRASDTVCREIGALMEHLWRDHTSDEMEGEEDIVEIYD